MNQILASALLLPLTIASLIGPGAAQAQTRVTCKNFTTQEEAQAYFNQTGLRSLDGDGDGVACERLPRSGKPQPTAPAAKTLPVVVSTGDGDTLRVRLERNQVVTVRMGCIDAPERTQTGGAQSAAWLKQKLPAGQAVQMRVIDRDQYGRVVAELFLGNQSVNLWAVQEGMAVVYPQFLSGCSATKDQYLQAETQAKQQRLGFWSQSNPVMPWDYRKQTRTSGGAKR